MKKLIEVTEVSGEGLESYMGERVTLFCMNYIYTGKLVGVNDQFVRLEDSFIVYETGAFNEKAWKDAQSLKNDNNPSGQWDVRISAIESYGKVK